MTKKTRVRVARIAAGAVIAAGASLTVTGVAQAAGLVGIGVETGYDDPTNPGESTEEPPNPGEPTEGPTEEPPNPGEPTGEPTQEPTEEPTGEPTQEPTGEPTEEPTGEPTQGPTEEPTEGPTGKPTEKPGGGSTGGNGAVGNGGGGDCTVDANGVACADNTDTDSVGNQPVEQGKGKDELAETGAAETTFLLVGAATMIAGGIGFRILPRLAGGNRTAA
ncbi:LPXTG cell wall anchor domain-containing protein [Streptomyces halstedii]|uniref:LPXTG cell wall anchor domain-containing protein n=1 Tax=Streptomyces halstedii TaxID=1944 RepID=UPI003694BB4D